MQKLLIEEDPEEPLSQADQDLVQAIKQAFWDVPYPGDDHIRGNALVLEKDEDLKAYYRTAWQDISLETVARYRNETAFFTIEGACYYLPVWMIAIICHPSESDTLANGVWSRLTPEDNPDLDTARSIVEQLRLTQTRVVYRFLAREKGTWVARFRSKDWQTIMWWKDQVDQKQLAWDLKHPSEFVPPQEDLLLSRDDLVWKKQELSQADREMMLAPHEVSLLARIQQAFAETVLPPPEDTFLDSDKPPSKEVRKLFEGKRWNEVPLSVVTSNLAPWNVLSPLGMAYYLPTWLTASIHDWDMTEELHTTLEYQFSPRESCPSGSCAGGDPEFQKLLSLLTLEQKRVLLWYFRYYQYKAEDVKHRAWVIQVWEEEIAKEEAHLAGPKAESA